MLRRLFRIQYASDLHLEFHDKANKGSIHPEMFLKPAAPYLALCGDIGFPERPGLRAFLEWCSMSYEAVFWVPGNHEFYNFGLKEKHTYTQKLDMCSELCSSFPNVHFLHRKSYLLPEYDLRISGCTLWTHIEPSQEMRMALGMNDVRQIYTDETENAFPADFREWHEADKAWLQKEIKDAEKDLQHILVLTHHLPSYKLIHPKYKDHPLNFCFASHLDSMIAPPVCGWLCGHSHSTAFTEINGIPCSLNPHGYPGESDTGFQREKVLEIKLE